MNDSDRIKELREYQIIGAPSDKELDGIARVASVSCQTPIALITFLDDRDQWLKERIGLDIQKMPRKDSFCQYALDTPDEILEVKDATKDSRFVINPLVTGAQKIRYYAGAPLVTANGHVLGTLCVLDRKPRELTVRQKEVLLMLADMVMRIIDRRLAIRKQREEIKDTADRLRKLTDQAPGVILQFEMSPDGKMSLPFLSKGLAQLSPHLDGSSISGTPELVFRYIHPDDLPTFKQKIKESYANLSEWYFEYRVLRPDGEIRWHMGRAIPEKRGDGTVVWYGTFQDITHHKEYEAAMEQISFDISHVLRKPVTNLLGLAGLIENDDLDGDKLKQYTGYIKTISEELDRFTRQLDEVYTEKSQKIASVRN